MAVVFFGFLLRKSEDPGSRATRLRFRKPERGRGRELRATDTSTDRQTSSVLDRERERQGEREKVRATDTCTDRQTSSVLDRERERELERERKLEQQTPARTDKLHLF